MHRNNLAKYFNWGQIPINSRLIYSDINWGQISPFGAAMVLRAWKYGEVEVRAWKYLG